MSTQNLILKKIELHEAYRKKCLNMIASENIASALAIKATSSDLLNRYTVGHLGSKLYAGQHYAQEIEKIATRLVKKALHAKYVNVQPISGMMANLVAYNAILKPNDVVMALRVNDGGHYSHNSESMLSLLKVKVENIPFDHAIFNIDVEATIKRIKKIKPKAIILGASVMLFPAPILELRKVCDEYNVKIIYDAAHVLGLIVGKEFQNPLIEGADILTSSTNKTLGAPDHGLIALRKTDKSLIQKIERAVLPILTSHHHPQNIAALAVTLGEFEDYGAKYAQQVICNAQALAQAIYSQGIKVVAANCGFTKSHMLIAQVSDAKSAMRDLEKANIIINACNLPHDQANVITGLRISTSELTKLGMQEEDMALIANLICDVLLKRRSLKEVKADVIALRKKFIKPKY